MMSETRWNGLYLGVALGQLCRAFDMTSLSFIFLRWSKYTTFSGAEYS
jgi:hypothetical protein